MMPAIVNTTELTLHRTIGASPAEVFDVWVNPKEPGSPWYGVAKAIVQPVVDGLFYHLVQFGGQDWAHYGRFTILDRPRRIEHTWVSRATHGLETIVSLTLEPAGNGTAVELRHRNVPDDEVGRQHQDGWGFVLGAIADKFAQRTSGT
jgi:uncharacterized protein YndB with AHSA1/START domain